MLYFFLFVFIQIQEYYVDKDALNKIIPFFRLFHIIPEIICSWFAMKPPPRPCTDFRPCAFLIDSCKSLDRLVYQIARLNWLKWNGNQLESGGEEWKTFNWNSECPWQRERGHDVEKSECTSMLLNSADFFSLSLGLVKRRMSSSWI
jgi:hypothetical protein